ncbi:enoyl-CoA hydratase-related protein [Nocardia sp. NPDC050710]|uniref:enoyl-CoA hydratase/isomerase family protein n=1 Tax=Nocardia sp. NPDC050710 TaxID=3157220 RepID=UPI0033FCACFE
MNDNLPVIDTHTKGATTIIRFNRPQQFNSIDTATRNQLRHDLAAASADPAVRAVVLTGSGRAFCAGQDLRELQNAPEGIVLGDLVREHFNPIVRLLVSMPKPVIAAVNGTAAGAGMALALACDLRIATESAAFTTAFAGIGLSCDTGMSWTLPRIAGRAAALDLLMRPRVIGSAEALRLGIVHQVVADTDFESSWRSLSNELAAGPTTALASIKASVNHTCGTTLEAAVDFEANQMTRTHRTRDHKTAVAAFLAKSAPVFAGY